MKQWFDVKIDLVEREDVKDIIQRPIRSRFGIRRPLIVNNDKCQTFLVAFNTVCSYIGTKDLVPEHIAFKVSPLVNEWEMPKETIDSSSEGGLVYLNYTYWYKSQFGEPDDKWLEAIEANIDDLLGAYTKAEDKAMNTAFGDRGKKKLNRVFDVFGFVYPDYCFPAQKQEAKRRIASTAPSTASKSKRMKIVTHWPKSFVLERAAALPAAEGSKVETVESVEATLSALEVIPYATAEATTAQLEKLKSESLKSDQQSKLQISPLLSELPRTATIPATTPRKGRRMVNVLDDVLKPLNVATPIPSRVSEDKVEELGEIVATSASPARAEARPSKTRLIEQVEESLPEKLTMSIPEGASTEDLDFMPCYSVLSPSPDGTFPSMPLPTSPCLRGTSSPYLHTSPSPWL
jgi:hypothetical protein